ncbi:MAG: DNA-directed RNA polymerase subunit D [Candidatus Methanoperedenaceae archaeon]|nr:DNA-directed RNA polymerase subunit D [Candidatus Methanoperedenaceae archaeon]
MDIDIIELSERKARFVLSGVSKAFANGLRRDILAGVPVLAIDDVNIYDNTSVLYDEQLALRLGLIPLKADTSTYNMPEDCSCGGEGCASCQVSLTLSAEGPRLVTSVELISTDPDVSPADDTIPIVELKDTHKVVLEAIARLGTGSKHAKWQAGIASGYKKMPVITIGECDLCEKCVEACPRNILKVKSNNLNIVNVIDCSMCNLCVEACEMDSIKVAESPDSFVMAFETTGAMTAAHIAVEAVNNIKKKAGQLGEILDTL